MTILTVILAGLFATGVMCVFLEIITRSNITNADMIRAVGSLFTKEYENSLSPGLFVQFSFGIFFSFIYFAVFSFFVPSSLILGLTAGFVMGFFHGMVVSMALVITVAEHHPLERFRESGFAVAIAHVIGHMLYGLTLGAIYGLTGAKILSSGIS